MNHTIKKITHLIMNFATLSDSHTDNISTELKEILCGFDTHLKLVEFVKNNNAMKKYSVDQINQLIWKIELKKRLESLNINFDKFNQFLINNKVKVTGSFVLQLILGETFDSYDIDLYVDTISKDLTTQIVENLGFTQIPQNIFPSFQTNHKYLKQIVEKVENYIVPDVYLQKTSADFRYKKELKIQLIETVNTFKGIESYINTFDFDILQNYYDGNSFTVRNLNNILNKTALYNEKFLGVRPFAWIIGRITKYKKRGFSIHFGENFLQFALSESQSSYNESYYPSGQNKKNNKSSTNCLCVLLEKLKNINNKNNTNDKNSQNSEDDEDNEYN